MYKSERTTYNIKVNQDILKIEDLLNDIRNNIKYLEKLCEYNEELKRDLENVGKDIYVMKSNFIKRAKEKK